MTTPDYMEPVVGYRHWHARSVNAGVDTGVIVPFSFSLELKLVSTIATEIWEYDRPLEATHKFINPYDILKKKEISEIAPMERCMCGIYAFAEPESHFIFSLSENESPVCAENGLPICVLYHGYVYGEVYMWGKVIRHAKGYRAQYAKPKVLYTFKHVTEYDYQIHNSVIEHLAELYNVPIIEQP